jgi:radical SAM superfamily enzyme YgiQ (UPF0313 family)
MTTIVIASVPWTDTDSPLMAPAALKSVLEKNSISCKALDINAEVRHKINSSDNRSSILKFFLNEIVEENARLEIAEILDYMAGRILEHDPEWVALSLLTYLSQIPTRWLCFLLKKKKPSVKIVIGGAGCFSTLKGIDAFTTELKSQKLIDHFIVGDGEQSLLELIQGQDSSGETDSYKWNQIRDLDSIPPPNYDDYDWSLYEIRRVSVWGSRGCVRDCTFCDIHEHWSKFTWRSADSIFQEIKYQFEKYEINLFSFADSLVNGNQKEFRNLINLLADYNRTLPDEKKIRWSGFFIFRPEEQMKEEDWKTMAESGAILLLVGIESFVEHIRYHIKKKFSNKDLDYGLRMAKKYGIDLSLLTIVGYVTETQEDFDQQLQWIRNNSHYANAPIKNIQMGSGLAILPGTWLHRHAQELGIKLSSTQVFQDWERPSINSTPELRMKWHIEMKRVLQENGFVPTYVEDNHVLIESHLMEKYGKINNKNTA